MAKFYSSYSIPLQYKTCRHTIFNTIINQLKYTCLYFKRIGVMYLDFVHSSTVTSDILSMALSVTT